MKTHVPLTKAAPVPTRSPRSDSRAIAAAVLQVAAESSGQPLDRVTRQQMEFRFGHDFGQVRVHTDRFAQTAAAAIEAAAFTIDQHIFFAVDRYQPHTPQGQWLIAHELTHTLQQRQAPILAAQPFQSIDRLEQEATSAAHLAVSDRPIPSRLISIAVQPSAIARQPAATAAPTAIDPARLTDFLVKTLLQNFQRDPEDRSGRLRRQLAQMTAGTRDRVLQVLRDRLRQAQWQQISNLITEVAPAGETPIDSAGAAESIEPATATEAPESTTETPSAQLETSAEETALPPAETTAEPVPPAVPAGEPAAQAPESPPEQPIVESEPPEATGETPTETTAAAAAPQTGTPPAPPAAPEGDATPDTGTIDRLEQRIIEGNPESEQAAPAPARNAPVEAIAASQPVPETEAIELSEPVSALSAEAIQPEAPAAEDAIEPPAVTTEAAVAMNASSPALEPVPEAIAEPPESTSISESEPAREPAAAIESEPAAPVVPSEPQLESAVPISEPLASTPTAEAVQAGSPTATSIAPAPVAVEEIPVESSATAIDSSTSADPAIAPAESAENLAPEPAQPEAAPATDHAGCPAGTAEAEREAPEAGAQMSESSGGGGGGAAITEQPSPEAPDLSQSNPAAAMGAVQNLPPLQLQQALGGVSAAADRSIADQQTQLAAQPPQIDRPTGAPPGQIGQATVPNPPAIVPTAQSIDRVAPAETVPASIAPALATSATPPPMSEPRLAGTAQQQLSESDVQQVQTTIRNLPATDPTLNVEVGAVPTLTLDGNADPARAREQRDRLDQTTQTARTQAQQAIARPMGETELYPAVPPETLRAQPASDSGSPSGAPAPPAASSDDRAAAIVAQQQHGDEIRSAATQAQQDMTLQQQEQQTQAAAAQTENQRQIETEIQRNAEQQTGERTRATAAVQHSRQEHRQEQQTLGDESRRDADQAGQQLNAQITRHRQDGDRQAAAQVQDGNTRIATKRREAEAQVAQERRTAERESGSILGWLASRLRSFFQGLFDRIRQAFAAARAAIGSLIAAARARAGELLDRAKQTIATAIRTLGGDRLLELGQQFLNQLRELGDRILNDIRDALRNAWNAVTRFVNQLREAVIGALNWLADRLRAGLALLQRAWRAAVSAVREAVRNAIQAARNALQSLAAFADLVRDIAANPGQWLRNLGAAAIDGVRNHLWNAMKTAMKNWFNSKVESVLSLGSLLQILIRGCISFAQIARMAWQAVIAALPMMVIRLLIEKLIALLVPAAEAVMLIIQGLQAAWGAMSQILAAIDAFVTFLKAVKGGNAGRQFANLLATAAVAVIDFISNFLLARLGSALGGVGQRLRGIAQRLQRIMGAVRRGAGAAARGVRTAARAIVQGGRRVVQAAARGARTAARAAGRVARRAGQALARSRIGRGIVRGVRSVGGVVRRGYQAVQRQVQRLRDRIRQWNERRRQRRQQQAQERLQRAVAAIRPPLEQMLERGTSRSFLWLRLQAWRLRYLLRSLSLQPDGSIVARVNPTAVATQSAKLTPQQIGQAIEPILIEAERRFLQQLQSRATENPSQGMQAAINRIAGSRQIAANSPTPYPIDVSRLLHSRAEQLYVLRQIRTLSPPLTNARIIFGAGAVIDFTEGRHTGYFVGYYVERAGGLKGSSYPILLQSVIGNSQQFNLDTSAVMRAIRSTNRGTMESRIRILRTRVALGNRTQFDQTLAPRIRMIGFLTQAVETARAPGMSAPTALAHLSSESPQRLLGRDSYSSATQAAGVAHPLGGSLAPMTPGGATAAVETRGALAPGETLSQSHQRAEELRHERIGNIFRRVRRAVENHEIRGLSRSQRRALQNLVSAFRQWLRAQESQVTTPSQVEELTRSILIFLQRYHGE